MKTETQIEYIYKQLGNYWPKYSNRKPAAKIHKEAYTSLIGVMLSAQSQDKRTAIACKQLFALALFLVNTGVVLYNSIQTWLDNQQICRDSDKEGRWRVVGVPGKRI